MKVTTINDNGDRGTGPLGGTPRVAKLRDVAERADVSLSAASRALSHAKGVSPSLAERVRRAADELGYRPHAGARGLRLSHTKTIAVIYHTLDNPGQLDLLRGIGRATQDRGYSLLVTDALGEEQRYKMLVQRLFERRVDGLILDSPGEINHELSLYRTAHIPVIALYRRHDTLTDVPVHSGLERNAISESLAHLLELGHTRVGYVMSVDATAGRADVISECLSAMEPNARLFVQRVAEPQTEDRVLSSVRYLLNEGGVSAMYVDHRSLPIVLAELQSQCIEVPRQLSVISFSESIWGHGFAPRISTIKVDVDSLGRSVADSLLDWIDGREPPATVRSQEAQWLERESIGPAPHLTAT